MTQVPESTIIEGHIFIIDPEPLTSFDNTENTCRGTFAFGPFPDTLLWYARTQQPLLPVPGDRSRGLPVLPIEINRNGKITKSVFRLKEDIISDPSSLHRMEKFT